MRIIRFLRKWGEAPMVLYLGPRDSRIINFMPSKSYKTTIPNYNRKDFPSLPSDVIITPYRNHHSQTN